jgi:ketopantoate reductase
LKSIFIRSGDTTLSASGWLFAYNFGAAEAEGHSVVLTCSSVVEPFLQKGLLVESSKVNNFPSVSQSLEHIEKLRVYDFVFVKVQIIRNPTLISGAEVDILLEELEVVSLHSFSSR